MNIVADIDGIIRRYPIVVELHKKIVPSFPLAVLCSFLDYDVGNLAFLKNGDLVLKDITLPGSSSPQDVVIPLDRRGNMFIKRCASTAFR